MDGRDTKDKSWTKMNIAQIENCISELLKNPIKESFIFDLLAAYSLPKSSITRLQKGNLNLAKSTDEILWKGKLFWKVTDGDLHAEITRISSEVKHNPRFIIVTDFKVLLAIDTKTKDNLDVNFKELHKHFDFFLPWAGMEKAHHVNENPADVKAAERMAKLFDAIKKDNPDKSAEFIHGLNVFLSRLLFCYFAEDTGIFKDDIFTNAIDSHTQQDGSDLNSYLDKLFAVLNTPEKQRQKLPDYLMQFPYVNGGLFRIRHPAPNFTRRSRQMLIDAGELDWKDINPDIFGSMFQAVIDVDQRGSLGQHYTSVPNIMKVIKPLFLDELYEAYENIGRSTKKRNELLTRIQKLKIFDPACGSGNFLIIAYKELRRLEMKILKGSGELALSGISLGQFYGIEIDDFAHEVAQLSLWLAEHQMNDEFYREFGRTNPTLPLKEAGKIVQGNACRIDWEEVCPKKDGDEIYILGNPPYLGDKLQSTAQKRDLSIAIDTDTKAVDYIAAWFIKASEFISNKSKFSFVSTNSICQGTQVPLIWPMIFNRNQEIFFAEKSFNWKNNAKNNAGVICSIIGVRVKSTSTKTLTINNVTKSVKNINAYLVDADSTIINKVSQPISDLPMMFNGNIPRDKGYLMLSNVDKDLILKQDPSCSKVIKKIVGSSEFLKNIDRWCLWITDEDLPIIHGNSVIQDRLKKIIEYRKNGSERGKLGLATPYKFERTITCTNNQLIIPRVSSSRREYVPIGFTDNAIIVSDAALAIYDPPLHVMSILTSKMHMTWVDLTAGRMKNDYRYSIGVCYNTFPFPQISEKQKQEITGCTLRILEEREKHPEKTLAQLYDPDKMPEGLREAHRANDIVIEKCYRSKPFTSDEERLEYLFKLYEEMIAEERMKQ